VGDGADRPGGDARPDLRGGICRPVARHGAVWFTDAYSLQHQSRLLGGRGGVPRAKRGLRDRIVYGSGTAGKAEWVFHKPSTRPLVVEAKLTANLRQLQLSDYIDARSGSPRRALALCRYVPPWLELDNNEWPHFAGVSLWRDVLPFLADARPAGLEVEWSAFVDRLARHDLAGVPAIEWASLAHPSDTGCQDAARGMLEDTWPWLLTMVQDSACCGEYGPGRAQEEQAVRGRKAPNVAIYRGNDKLPVLTLTLRPRAGEGPAVTIEERRVARGGGRGRRARAETCRREVPLDRARGDPVTALRGALLEADLWLLGRRAVHADDVAPRVN
jgi:hypothetical protein